MARHRRARRRRAIASWVRRHRRVALDYSGFGTARGGCAGPVTCTLTVHREPGRVDVGPDEAFAALQDLTSNRDSKTWKGESPIDGSGAPTRWNTWLVCRPKNPSVGH